MRYPLCLNSELETEYSVLNIAAQSPVFIPVFELKTWSFKVGYWLFAPLVFFSLTPDLSASASLRENSDSLLILDPNLGVFASLREVL
jgi:hypothetical protein